MPEFSPATPLQKALLYFTKLTAKIPEEELDRILAGASCGPGLRGWWRGCEIRNAKREMEELRELILIRNLRTH
jgi:hypothetical protein